MWRPPPASGGRRAADASERGALRGPAQVAHVGVALLCRQRRVGLVVAFDDVVVWGALVERVEDAVEVDRPLAEVCEARVEVAAGGVGIAVLDVEERNALLVRQQP